MIYISVENSIRYRSPSNVIFMYVKNEIATFTYGWFKYMIPIHESILEEMNFREI